MPRPPRGNSSQQGAPEGELTQICPSGVALRLSIANQESHNTLSRHLPPAPYVHVAAGRFTSRMHQSGLAGLSGLCRVTDHLYLSNVRAAKDSAQVTRCGINCIVNVTETQSRRPLHPGVEYLHIPLPDSPLSPLSEHFDDVADKIQFTAERGGRTLVHCNAGVSRSASLCMAYLMKHRGVPLLEAHGWVRSCRPVVRPNNGFWKQLIRYEMELRGCASVRMVVSSMGEVPDIYEQEARNMMPL